MIGSQIYTSQLRGDNTFGGNLGTVGSPVLGQTIGLGGPSALGSGSRIMRGSHHPELGKPQGHAVVKRTPVTKTYVEQVPETVYNQIQKSYVEQVPEVIYKPVTRYTTEVVPQTIHRDVQKSYVDYIEHEEITQYKPVPRMEQYTETVPVQKTRTVYDYEPYTETRTIPGTVMERSGVNLSGSRIYEGAQQQVGYGGVYGGAYGSGMQQVQQTSYGGLQQQSSYGGLTGGSRNLGGYGSIYRY